MLSNLIIKKCTRGGEMNSAARVRIGKASGVVGIILNAMLFAAKLAAGFIVRSLSVIADAVNNLSDASSNVITCVGFKMASRPADKGHPYGHGRYEYLSALFIAVIIIALGVEIMIESIKKIISPVPTEFSFLTVGILCAAILIKLWMFFFYRRLGKKVNSQTLAAASVDSLCDCVATAVILAGTIISRYTSVDLDGPLGIAAALFILYGGLTVVKRTVDTLLGKAPDKEYTESVKKRILQYDGVTGTHDLMVHDYGPSRQFASVHVEMPEELGIIKCHEIIDKIERDFLESDGLHLVVHPDPIAHQDDETRKLVEDCLKEVDGKLTIHDLKTVVCGDKTKLIFDCAAPEDSELAKDEIKEKIIKAVKTKRPDFECEITVDSGFACITD